MPSAYYKSIGIRYSAKAPDNPYAWQSRTVADILAHPEYIGHTVNFKTYKKSYKSKKKLWNDPSKWQTFGNTHEAIIDQETFDIVQRIYDGRRRLTPMGEMPILSGMLFCADCGAKLHQVRARGWTHEQEHFVCATYRKVKGGCSSHQIHNVQVEEILLRELHRITAYAREHESEFIELVTKQSEKDLNRQLRDSHKELEQSKSRQSASIGTSLVLLIFRQSMKNPKLKSPNRLFFCVYVYKVNKKSYIESPCKKYISINLKITLAIHND